MPRALAASVQQRLAFGERAGQRVRRIGSGFGDEGETPTLTGTRCASVNGFSLHANTHVPTRRPLRRRVKPSLQGLKSASGALRPASS